MPDIRAFVAVELPEPVRALLGGAQATLSYAIGSHAVRWVQPAGIHLTLKFLGNIPGTQVPAIAQALERVAVEQPPLALTTGGLGWFPPRGAIRVVWAGVEGQTAELALLQQQVEDALAALGHQPDGRAFSPHLTLGRVREGATPAEQRAIAAALARTTLDQRLPILVEALTLFESRLQPTGAVYHALAHIPLSRPRHTSGN